MDIDAYARHKLAQINARENTNHGEEYLAMLREEVAAQFAFADMTFERQKKSAPAGCRRTQSAKPISIFSISAPRLRVKGESYDATG